VLQKKHPPAIFLMGATAAGKTALAIELVKHYPCEIISVDSALIYKGMDIGTAKPDQSELNLAPHFLIDIINPDQSYSAWEFRDDALKLMGEITARGNIPLLVGGTMLYFNTLEFGMDDLPQSDESYRQHLTDRMKSEGLPSLYAELKEIDLISAERIKPNDKQRIMRALEVFHLSGKPLSQLQQHKKESTLEYELIKIILAPEDRALLHQRISNRFDLMLEQGFINEVKHLRNHAKLSNQLSSMRCVGYRQAWEYLDDEVDFQTMKDKACAATRQLAKRQITWLRKQQNAQWFDSDHFKFSMVDNYIKKQLI